MMIFSFNTLYYSISLTLLFTWKKIARQVGGTILRWQSQKQNESEQHRVFSCGWNWKRIKQNIYRKWSCNCTPWLHCPGETWRCQAPPQWGRRHSTGPWGLCRGCQGRPLDGYWALSCLLLTSWLRIGAAHAIMAAILQQSVVPWDWLLLSTLVQLICGWLHQFPGMESVTGTIYFSVSPSPLGTYWAFELGLTGLWLGLGGLGLGLDNRNLWNQRWRGKLALHWHLMTVPF